MPTHHTGRNADGICCRVVAHFDGGQGQSEVTGEPGKPQMYRGPPVSRWATISCDPRSIRVSAGETVRCEIANEAVLVEGIDIGTSAMHKAHQHEMMEMMKAGVSMPDRRTHSKMKSGARV